MLHARVHKGLLLVITAALAALSACTSAHVPERRTLAGDTAELANTLEQLAIAHAYHERLHLGMGSPYRLIEAVLRDARLDARRASLAGELLDSIQAGHFAQISPLVLVDAGVDSTSAIAQLELMRQTVERSPNPRIAEAAVALVYTQLVADSLIPERVQARAMRVAALLRDRQLALADARRLSHEADRLGIEPRDLVLSWRRDRRFAVEQPTIVALDSRERAEAERIALLMRGGVIAALTPARSELNRTIPPNLPYLSRPDAELLLAAGTRDPKAQGALVITLRALARGAAGTHTRSAEPNWQEFFERVQDEESLVAALVRAPQDSLDQRVAAGIALEAAIALRPFAQERLAAIDSIGPAMLSSRFGVRVRFGTRLTPASRTKLLSEIYYALADVQRVLPGLRLTGLVFDVRPITQQARYQAYHDPRNRVIRIDPDAAAGTLAHELGHDLDWQLARRKYDASGTYATDYAVRRRKNLAYLIANLQRAERPAEVFARRFEWYVMEALGSVGRSNGFLSSIQNEWLVGYGSAVRPESTPLASSSFVSILAQATEMDPAARQAAELLVRRSDWSIDELLSGGLARQNALNFPIPRAAELNRLRP